LVLGPVTGTLLSWCRRRHHVYRRGYSRSSKDRGIRLVIILATILGYGPGWGAGLLAGGLTQSAVIGVASAAIEALPGVDSGQAKEYESQIAVGYAVCYLFGTAAAAYFLSNIAPRMVGTKDLAAASHALERDLGVAEEPDISPAYYSIVRRAYQMTGDAVVGKTVGAVRTQARRAGHDVIFHEVQHAGQISRCV
jgi:putative transport protein